MNCTSCGAPLNPNETFCSHCGAVASPVNIHPTSAYPSGTRSYSQPSPQMNHPQSPAELPPEYRPLSPWAYWGLQLLYSVPIVGLVFLIIFSIKKDNINRRNFTLSYWVGFLIFFGLLLTTALVLVIIDIDILFDLIDEIF